MEDLEGAEAEFKARVRAAAAWSRRCRFASCLGAVRGFRSSHRNRRGNSLPQRVLVLSSAVCSCDSQGLMWRRSRPAGERRRPHHGLMETDELFLQLHEEVSRLQELCMEQHKLLQKLAAKRGPVLDIPVLLPMQCTEDTVVKEAQRPLHSPQREDAPSESAQPAEAPVEIRGPGKPSWTPGWVLEDAALGPGTILTSEDAQAWDIGQEASPRMQEAKRTL